MSAGALETRTRGSSQSPPPSLSPSPSLSQPTTTTATATARKATAGQRRHVRLANQKLFEMAAATAARTDWDSLCRPERVPLGLATTRARSRVAVTARAVAACSVAELRAVIRPAASADYVATMREMFGPAFVYGAVVHRATSAEAWSPTTSTSLGASSPLSASRSPLSSSTAAAAAAADSDVQVKRQPSEAQVKTITFSKRHVLALSEQWCVLDALHEVRGVAGGAFAVTMTSVRPDDVFLGKTHAEAVSALVDISAAYAVVPTPLEAGAGGEGRAYGAQITFRVESELRAARGLAVADGRALSRGAVARRLQELARATLRLVDVVRARRLNAQVYVDPRAAALAVPPSAKTRCACCTRRFLYAARRKQCHLCGFFVCAGCSVVHELPRAGGRRFLVRVCAHCREWVDDGCYDNVALDAAPPRPRIVPDDPGGLPAATKLHRALAEAMDRASSSPGRKAAVKTVVRRLVEVEVEQQPQPQPPHRTDEGEEGDEELRAGRRLLTSDSSDAEHLEAFSAAARGSEDPPVRACATAESRSRRYPIANTAGQGGPVPVPRDEERRLRWLAEASPSGSLAEIKDLPELEVLCELARRALGCQLGSVTVVTRDAVHVVATSDPRFRGTVMPRDQSFCPHAIMDPRLPLLLPHPEADVRFCKMGGVRTPLGPRFYFGFPLQVSLPRGEDGPVVGTICCSDVASRPVTPSHYATLARLAASAARILAERHEEQRAQFLLSR